jgi:undecaprenyl pyrophosphate phosphatase UppP
MIPLEFPRMAMNLIEALGVGIVEVITDFLPVSSTGHLTSSGARGRSSRSR